MLDLHLTSDPPGTDDITELRILRLQGRTVEELIRGQQIRALKETTACWP